MNIFQILLQNPVIDLAALAWIIAQGSKLIIELISPEPFRWARFFQSGGMPSSHSASVVCAATAIGRIYGFDGGLFAVAGILAMVVMYDAANVRLTAERTAEIVNDMNDGWTGAPLKREHKRLPEHVGHTLSEVFVGAVMGALIGYFGIRFF